MNVLIFGCGYTGEALARQLLAQGVPVAGTRRDAGSASSLGLAAQGVTIAAFDSQTGGSRLAPLIAQATHVIISIPPGRSGEEALTPSPLGEKDGSASRVPVDSTDPVLRWHGADLSVAPNLRWIGYLSTVGVYGDHSGAWVDETTAPVPVSPRSRERLAVEAQWLDLGHRSGKRVEIFRIAGIYGPGRSAVDNVKAGTARRIIKPGQVFNRIHVDDIASVLQTAMRRPADAAHHIFNLADDEPAPPQDVVAYAAQLLGIEPPPAIRFEDANLSPMGASFYSECKRVRNDRIKAALGVRLAYPTFREGLQAVARQSL